MNIYQSIAKIMQEAGAISKGRKNEQQGYKFRGIDDVYNEFNPHLAANGVFFCPNVLDMKREERVTQKGGNLIYTILTVQFDVYAADGTSVRLVTIGEAMDSGDKSANKAMSAAFKYALMELFCIPTEDEKDTEAQTHDVAPKNSAVLNPSNVPTQVQTATAITKERAAEVAKTPCQKCGAPMTLSKEGKPYCSQVCWKKTPEEQAAMLTARLQKQFTQAASQPDAKPTEEISLDQIPF